jgi:hypothetical protein
MKMSENINELATALVVAQGLIQNPTKSVSNAFFKSKYADLAGVIDVCRPAFTEAGIAVIQAPSTTDDGSIAVTTTLVRTRLALCLKSRQLASRSCARRSNYATKKWGHHDHSRCRSRI